MSSNSQQKKPVRPQPPIIFISLGLIAVTILTMFILCLCANAGKSTKNPVLAIYGVEGNVPSVSLANTLHAAGFEYDFLDYGDPLPQAANVVVAGVGEDALSVIDQYRYEEHVRGFILICPSYRPEYMENISASSPLYDIAVFAGRDNAKTVADMKDARIIYERLSGDDSLYGQPIRRGGLFASRVYVNNDQNRTLSLSAFAVRDPSKLFFSPLFQNELAGYLSVTYIDESTRETSFGRINAWFILVWIAITFAAVSVLLYYSNVSVDPTGSDPKKAPVSRWVYALIIGISVAVCVGIISTLTVERLRSPMIQVLSFLPSVFMLCLFIVNFKWIYEKKGKFAPSGRTFVPAAFMAVVTGLYVLFTLILTSDLYIRFMTDKGLYSALLALMLIADTSFATGLIYASRRSSAAGQGAKNMFGNRKILLLMFIPAAAAVITGLVPWETEVFYAGLAGLAATGIPYLVTVPLVRHTDRSLIPGVLHGVVYTLILAAAL